MYSHRYSFRLHTMTWMCTKTNHFKPLVILLLTVGFCHSIRLRLIYMAIKTIKAKFRNISHHIDSIRLRGTFIHIFHYIPRTTRIQWVGVCVCVVLLWNSNLWIEVEFVWMSVVPAKMTRSYQRSDTEQLANIYYIYRYSHGRQRQQM